MPSRKCIITHKSLPSSQLIRFVASPDGEVLPDISNRLGGRGAWLCADYGVLAKAIKQGRLLAALRAKFIGDDLPGRVETLLVKRCQQQLGLGRRAGLVIGGGGVIRTNMKKHKIDWLLVASDTSPREAASLTASSRPNHTSHALHGHELGRVFGRPSLAFVAVFVADTNKYGEQLAATIGRLAGIRRP